MVKEIPGVGRREQDSAALSEAVAFCNKMITHLVKSARVFTDT